jgi:hypothetical protein
LFAIFVIFISILTGLQLFGFNLSVLVAGSAALLVGLGLGYKIYLGFYFWYYFTVGFSVKVHDVIELNGMGLTVQEINLGLQLFNEGR